MVTSQFHVKTVIMMNIPLPSSSALTMTRRRRQLSPNAPTPSVKLFAIIISCHTEKRATFPYYYYYCLISRSSPLLSSHTHRCILAVYETSARFLIFPCSFIIHCSYFFCFHTYIDDLMTTTRQYARARAFLC